MDSIYVIVDSPLLALFFLAGNCFLTLFSTSLLLMGKYKSQEELEMRVPSFFFRKIMKKFFHKDEWENLYFMISFTKHILLLLYASFAFFFAYVLIEANYDLHAKEEIGLLSIISLIILGVSLILDFTMRLLSMRYVRKSLSFSASIVSVYLLIFFPITALFLKITRFFFRVMRIQKAPSTFLLKDKIREMIHDSGMPMNAQDQKMITSFVTFKERKAKEIMVPRIDVTALEASTSIKEAASLFINEQYSRIPVYKESLDEVIGVLLYKDLLELLIKAENDRELLNKPIGSYLKPVIYAPENKKISHLLQEFRAKQLHLAIVVDEYGGTEGIVTIEDILEELVGEIEDEYDFDEEEQFIKLSNGSYIVDAKMSIIDIENKLGITIPDHTEYETIGGYIFHTAGTIPSKGWSMHHDAFDLVVLSSSERTIEKIRITPNQEKESS